MTPGRRHCTEVQPPYLDDAIANAIVQGTETSSPLHILKSPLVRNSFATCSSKGGMRR